MRDILGDLRVLKFLLMTSLLLIVVTSQAQDQREKFNFWMISAGGGATLLFGDLSEEYDNPLEKYFTDQQGWAGSINVHKRLAPSFALNAQGTFGNLQGYRTYWSNDLATNLEFSSNITELQLNAELNLLNIFNPKPRFINFFVKAGAGYVFYDAAKTSTITNQTIGETKGSAFVIPWGFGGRLDFNERWGFYGETSFHHAFSDEIDAHDSKVTDVNDIYTYTSFGITYKMFPKERKRKVDEIEIIPVDTQDVAVVEELDPIAVSLDAPTVAEPGKSFTIRIQIDKGTRNENAKLQQTLPLGFSAENPKHDNGSFQFKDQICNFSWEAFPENEILNLEYTIRVDENIDEKSYIIPGILFYTENGEEKIHHFKHTMNIERPVIAEAPVDTASSGTTIDEPTPVDPGNQNISQPQVSDSGIEYRVQVRAIYGGKSSPAAVAKRYKIDQEIYEDYHGGYMKYTTGSFNSYEEAAQLKQQLRAANVPGAFVVAFKDGKRIDNIHEAIKMSNEGGGQIKKQGDNTQGSQGNSGINYKIQIAASGRDFSADQIKSNLGISQSVSKEVHNGLNKYMVGPFSSYSEAKEALDLIKPEVKDAFIVKYTNGKR